jgi:hypothetical protein
MHTTRRKVVDEEDAHELLDAWEESRGSFRAFCAEQGVDGRSLQCWRQNLGRQEDAAAVRLVELTSPTSTARASYRVVLGDIAIEVDDGFQEDTLTRLLAVVAGC